MTNSEAVRQVTQVLYGLEDVETVQELLEELGPAALTQKAMIRLAQLQLDKHNRLTSYPTRSDDGTFR